MLSFRTHTVTTPQTAVSTITVRNVPDAVVRELKARAERNRRSLNGEVVTVLEEAVLARSPGDVLADVEAAHALFPDPLPDLAAEGKRAGRKYDAPSGSGPA